MPPWVRAEHACAAAAAAARPPLACAAGEWEQRSGEEKGPNGYWYRWTETRGRDATGSVQWFERVWEASDWEGMRELGAEKWGANANGERGCLGGISGLVPWDSWRRRVSLFSFLAQVVVFWRSSGGRVEVQPLRRR